ncbi:MAG: CRISPR-associated endonuclease Cas2 [Pseudoxanthomonas sp.]
MARTLHLVAYDISNPRRLSQVCRYFKSYRVAGQKSVPEIWITLAELHTIQSDIEAIIDPATDRIQIIALDPRMTPACLGRAATFQPQSFRIV